MTPAASGKSRIVVRLDQKGRGDKSSTVIEDLRPSVENSEKLLKQIKAKLGTGGAVKNGGLEIQGEHCDVKYRGTLLLKLHYVMLKINATGATTPHSVPKEHRITRVFW